MENLLNIKYKSVIFRTMASCNLKYLFCGLILLSISENILSLETPNSDSFRSIIQDSGNGIQDSGNGIQDNFKSFDFGEEFYVDDILDEMHKMGLRPKVGEKAVKLPCYDDDCIDNVVVKSSSNASATGNEMNIVDFDLDYMDDDDAVHNVQTRSADVSDILSDPVKGERQARLFYNFDRGSAFNTSVAFTIPLFSFTLPGAGDVTDGVDGNVFGTMAFVSLFLLGGLGVAIYTTTQGALGDGGDARMITPTFPGAQFLSAGTDASFVSAVYEGMTGLSDALELPSCSHLAVCEAYQESELYGFMALPFKIWAPLRSELPETDLTPHEGAARFATEGGDCQKKYTCIVDPVYTMDMVYKSAVKYLL